METDTYNKTLSRNLKAIRRRKSLTTSDLAKILNVSQSKISYIENCKGVLSARDVAILARKLGIPVTAFFEGLDKAEETSPSVSIAGQLASYGAILLARPSVTPIKEIPYEDVFSQSLGFLEDDRLNKGFCAALFIQATEREINVGRILSLAGNNPFLVRRIIEKVQDCLKVIEILKRGKEEINPRAIRQLENLLFQAQDLRGGTELVRTLPDAEVLDLAEFVRDCLHAKK